MQANIKTLQNGISTAALKKIIHKLCVATWSCGLLAIYTMNQRCCGFLSVWQLNLPCSTFLNGLWADPGFVWITLSNPNSCHTILQLHIGQKMTQNWLEGPSHPQQNSNTRKLQKGKRGGSLFLFSLLQTGKIQKQCFKCLHCKREGGKSVFFPSPPGMLPRSPSQFSFLLSSAQANKMGWEEQRVNYHPLTHTP